MDSKLCTLGCHDNGQTMYCSSILVKCAVSSLGVTVAAKGYFDALVKLGELASDSQGSKELGECVGGREREKERGNLVLDWICWTLKPKV